MHPSKPARSYLDPDAVGPLPRSSLADDSDALAAARTMLRVPSSAVTQEIGPGDVLEEFDPNRPMSVAPVGYETSEIRLPRRSPWPYVAGIAGVLVVLIFALAIGGSSRPQASAAASIAPAKPVVTAPSVPAVPATAAPTVVTVGTLRVDATLQGQRVFVDGVVLTVPAALVRCGPHDVAIGSADRKRAIDVPCGGEVTLYR